MYPRGPHAELPAVVKSSESIVRKNARFSVGRGRVPGAATLTEMIRLCLGGVELLRAGGELRWPPVRGASRRPLQAWRIAACGRAGGGAVGPWRGLPP